jgi:phenylpyruvate tautomerase PptA (4-oxalocrotonate tautomerase family)
MPWINLTLRRGALPKPVQHAMMAKLTEVLMWWEKVPSTPTARKIMKGWVYEVAEDADYNAGSPHHDKPFYFLEIRIPINRLDLLAKQGLIRDFMRVVLEAEGSDNSPDNARRVWVTIIELKAEDWGIGGHTDWLRDYTSALDEVGNYQASAVAQKAA